MSQQLSFTDLLAEADEQESATRDRCRMMAQLWFDQLSSPQKKILADLLVTRQYDTCVALCAAAGDWLRSPAPEVVGSIVLRKAS